MLKTSKKFELLDKLAREIFNLQDAPNFTDTLLTKLEGEDPQKKELKDWL